MEPDNHAAQSRYEAAESMLQHARTPRTQQQALDGRLLPKTYPIPQKDSPHPLNRIPTVPVSPYPSFSTPIQRDHVDQVQAYNPMLDRHLASPQESKPRNDHQTQQAFMRQPATNAVPPPSQEYRHPAHGGFGTHDASLKNIHPASRSEPLSPSSSRAAALKETESSKASTRPPAKKSGKKSVILKEEDEKPPPWSELKTKAGKDRKRLPLACIACRRKKIRCSGEKPACKHCLRSRIPCVYKTTTRKAAPRTDYMAMLDKRLKRMEERVIKILPGDEVSNTSATGRANVRPSTARSASNARNGKKRAAEEAFGPDLEEWAQSRSSKQTMASREYSQDQMHTEGADKLPSQEIQEHLAEVFFDCVYGQSYLLLHKPSFMRRLRAGAAPPVLVLGVCAIAARFSTHPQVNSEPAFLRGEEWAAPAREIVLKSYDQPSITILTVLLILGLHEFGTCQGGRSWMFCGMAMRMAYALQLHRELDYDPLVRKDDADPKLSATDREIRRRAMWACFLMDRFSSSGTERPTCGAEDYIKIQLPTKEFNFQNEIPGPVETLANETMPTSTLDAEQKAKPKDSMGVASYMVRVIVLWGRVILYLNLGGKEKDPHELWHPQSSFSSLQKQVEDLRASLPSDLQFTADNLAHHATEKLANQFLLLHISYHQIVLFLHRHAIPITPGAIMSHNTPKDFQSTSAHVAVEAAGQISDLIHLASEHNLVAPFAGYCAFTSSTVHIWSMFSNQLRLRALAKRKLEMNINYIGKMKRYWGMFHFMGDNLKDIWKRHHDHALQKSNGTAAANNSDSSLFQYGDWFKKYPNGVSETDYRDAATKGKGESVQDSTSSQQSDLQSVEAFFNNLSPSARGPPGGRKPARKLSEAIAVQTRAHPPLVLPPNVPLEGSVQSMTAIAGQTPIAPSPFSPHPPQAIYSSVPPQTYESMGPSADSALLPPLGRNLVYNAYAGTSGPPMTSTDSSFMPLSMEDQTTSLWEHSMGEMGVHAAQAFGGMGNYMGEVQRSSAWFMPFNMPPPTGFPGEVDGGYRVFPMDGNHASGMDGAGRQQ
ncbi:MAG: hypothetical protein L6R42_001508 [Xanthoria sp. 1 TBL-2021]|nr:MAG: hypothetical protein L6R42_001508 [Xanthoria sp. 1 TBL-2021]